MLPYGSSVQGLPSDPNLSATDIGGGCTDNTMQFSVSSLLRLGQNTRTTEIESNEGKFIYF